MEKKYKITYLPLFYNDLDKITDYIKYQLENEIFYIQEEILMI